MLTQDEIGYFVTLRKEQNDSKKSYETYRGEILARLKANEPQEAGEVILSIKPETRTDYNVKQLLADHPELAEIVKAYAKKTDIEKIVDAHGAIIVTPEPEVKAPEVKAPEPVKATLETKPEAKTLERPADAVVEIRIRQVWPQ